MEEESKLELYRTPPNPTYTAPQVTSAEEQQGSGNAIIPQIRLGHLGYLYFLLNTYDRYSVSVGLFFNPHIYKHSKT